jgi:hypothetical protein
VIWITATPTSRFHKASGDADELLQEVFGLKRMSLVFVFIILFLSPRRSARALLRIAAKHDVRNGILVVKGGDGGRTSARLHLHLALSERRWSLTGTHTGEWSLWYFTKEGC